MAGGRRAAGEEESLRLLEETYLEISARLGWRILNCHHYSTKFNVCYGAPIFLGNRKVWREEGSFEELNRKLKMMGYKPITWDYFRELMRRVERQGVIWVNWFMAPSGEVEPHDITIMKPVFLRDY
jgi:hypothetical protein